MSQERLRRDADRWIRQAEDDFKAVTVLLDGSHYTQAAFLSQQAAEKALKALWIALDLDPWGHSVTRLINDLPAEELSHLKGFVDRALYLDKLYIPTRYPDALAELTPSEAFTRSEAEAAREHARVLIEAVRDRL